MAKYKEYDHTQSVLIPVSLEEQLIPGTLEFAIHHLIEERLDTSVLDDRYSNDETGRKAYNLSGGERRRVEIARALVTTPSFILLDEPFAGIDPLAVIDIQKVVGHLKERGIGVVISDHNVRETLGVCDRAYILSEGVLIESGPPEAIAASSVAREVYLGEGFRL